MPSITGNLKFVTNDAAALSVTFVPKSTPKADGANVIAGTEKTVVTDATGAIPATTLINGKYAVKLGNGEEFNIDVPAGAGPYDLSAIVDATAAPSDTSNYVRRQFTLNASTAASATASEISLIDAGQGSATIPANFLTIGKKLQLTASGIMDTPASPPTLTVRFKIGSTTWLTISFTPTANLLNNPWFLNVIYNYENPDVFSEGRAVMQLTFQDAAPNAKTYMAQATDQALDATIANAVNLTAQWGSGIAGTRFHCFTLSLEAIP